MANVITLEQLKNLKESNSSVIEIPGFTDDQAIGVRVKKVSLLELTQCGVLPNALLVAVNNIFVRRSRGDEFTTEEVQIYEKQMEEFTEVVYKAALIEPTAEDFDSVGMPLTKIQKRVIAEYSIGDTSTLERFRKYRESIANNSDGQELPDEA